MSFNPQSPPKRPRLSLQIKTPATSVPLGKSTTALKADIDPTSPTAFNTLSNAYAVAIENASPRTARPMSSDIKSGRPTSLRLETKNFGGDAEYIHPSQRTQTPGPFSIAYPDTPSSPFPSTLTGSTYNDPTSTSNTNSLTPKALHPLITGTDTSATSFTFTPPQSAGSDRSIPQIFTFAANDGLSPSTPRTSRRRIPTSPYQVAPYTHPRTLHSILRNSPLPPRTAITPATPSRTSMRLANRAAKKVGYNDPLTQTITTNKYIKSHIDLLVEDSPYSATSTDGVEGHGPDILDLTMAYTGNETRDGGQTPGPFEEMRRRMAESELATPGSKKRKRREKKRKWEWTISSVEGEDETGGLLEIGGEEGETPVTAVKLQKTPITAIRRGVSVSTDGSVSEVEVEERYVPEMSVDSEMERTGREGVVPVKQVVHVG